LTSGDTPNYTYQTATLSVIKDGKAFATLTPQRRFYKASQQPISHVAIRESLAGDLYIVLAGRDQTSGKSVIEVFVNPLVAWVWMGGAIMVLGTLIALIPSRAEREMAQIRQASWEALEERNVL
ncbi:MAG TPA: cytochrome c-type biogenesis CcmF C-terminal domain-containing protein, partial [Terriglobia bacterium]|nr:cytochrome c-type biogenesis CcmF C-terminal domain-containing protein [Terriglobia bacterium]